MKMIISIKNRCNVQYSC